MICKNCGCEMEGDGITIVFHCANIDLSTITAEPDANPIYCDYDPYDENGHQG